ncbi:MAG TPA: DUF359 domain-containing protein [Candidatus Altiarchaeales archaeon]|nr:DUF359 domain-containing protein [Candidatus Altiarchaeales archaeon]
MELTPRLREALKKPLGEVSKTLDRVGEDDTIICVGDKASQALIEAGFKPKIIVYDGLTMRTPIQLPYSIKKFDGVLEEIENPAGRLEPEAFELVAKALGREGSTKISVDGEEDLIALAAIRLAEDGALVIYGQPGEGLVFVRVDGNVKDKVESILEEMI